LDKPDQDAGIVAMSKFTEFTLSFLFYFQFMTSVGHAASVDTSLQQAYQKRASAGLLSGVAILKVGPDSSASHFFGEGVRAEAVFEIGSVTKSLTGILLADISIRKGIPLQTPLSTLMPELKSTFAGTVTLLQLATHTARLPRLLPSASADKASSERARVLEFLKRYEPDPTAFPAGKSAYSNLGFQTLGLVISELEKKSFAMALQERIFTPLQMTTCTSVGFAENKNVLPGYDFDGRPAAAFLFEDLDAASGGIRSCALDLQRFVKALVEPGSTPLKLAIQTATAQGLGFDIATADVVGKNGATYGFTAQLFVNLKAHQGVLVLSNLFNLPETLELALVALGKPDTFSSVPTEFKNFDLYKGRYNGKGLVFSDSPGMASESFAVELGGSATRPTLSFFGKPSDPESYLTRLVSTDVPDTYELRDGLGLMSGEIVKVKIQNNGKAQLQYLKIKEAKLLGTFQKL
jgi:D-alanyl-D-alanine-carboxypeptidase/D-alanyl-D-alanine-endopeptidase